MQHCAGAGLTSPSLPFLAALARARCWGASWPRCGWAPGIPAAGHHAELSWLARQHTNLSSKQVLLRRVFRQFCGRTRRAAQRIAQSLASPAACALRRAARRQTGSCLQQLQVSQRFDLGA